jgi:hypothetical protein
MYNTDFLPQLEAFRRHLCGVSGEDIRRSNEGSIMYSLPAKVKIIPCEPNEHGEYLSVKLLDETGSY